MFKKTSAYIIMYVFIRIKKYIYTYSVKKSFCMCVIMTSQSIIRIQILIIKQFYPRLLCSHRIYKNMYWSDQKVIMYIIEKFGDYKIQNYNPTIFVEILMGNLLKVVLFPVITVVVVERRWRLLMSKCRLVGSRFVLNA